jgi:type II secretory pathway component GspD/PulD (secretin)
LICLINEYCEIKEGGEIPIKTKNFSYSIVKWKPYGLSIKFKPTLTYNNKVNYQLDYHLSHPDFTQVADGTPSFKIKKISTVFSSSFNKPIYIGGLTIDSKSKSQSGRLPFNLTPLLQNILNSNVTSNSKSNLFLIINSELIESKQYD